MSLRVVCRDDGVEHVISAATPVNRLAFGFLNKCVVRQHFIHSTKDEHGSLDRVNEVFRATLKPKALIWFEAGDHFFAGKPDKFAAAAPAAILAP